MNPRFFAKNKLSVFFALLIMTGVFVGFGLTHLGKFHTADEDLWFANPVTGRIHAYWTAMLTGDWEHTRVNDKPGITTAIVSGSIGLLYDTEPEKKVLEKDSYYRISDPEVNERAAFFFRLPLVFFNAIAILYLFFLVRAYTQKTFLSLVFTLFLFLSPMILGISQIVNPDATLWSLSAICLFSYLLLLKKKQWKFLFFAILSGGFALLSKYVAVFLLLFLFFITLVRLVFFFHRYKTANDFHREAKQTLLYFPLFLAGTLGIFSLGMPAVFENPSHLYSGTIGFRHSKDSLLFLSLFLGFFLTLFVDTLFLKNKLLAFFAGLFQKSRPFVIPTLGGLLLLLFLFTLVNWSFGNLFQLASISFDNARSEKFTKLFFWEKFAFEARPIVFTLPPIVLFFLFVELVRNTLSFRHPRKFQFLSFVLLSFVLLFLCAMVSQDLLINSRYGILLYPPLLLLSALGAKAFFHALPQKRFPFFTMPFFFIALFLISLYSLFKSHPFYFNYTNILLPQTEIVTTAWGYGGYEAAQYLNALPDAKNLYVWTDYEGFCNFFVGKCIKGPGINQHKTETFGSVDYYVVSRRGKQIQKNLWAKIRRNDVMKRDPVWSLFILDRTKNFVSVYQGTKNSEPKNSEPVPPTR